jgi:hypothetical protein
MRWQRGSDTTKARRTRVRPSGLIGALPQRRGRPRPCRGLSRAPLMGRQSCASSEPRSLRRAPSVCKSALPPSSSSTMNIAVGSVGPVPANRCAPAPGRPRQTAPSKQGGSTRTPGPIGTPRFHHSADPRFGTPLEAAKLFSSCHRVMPQRRIRAVALQQSVGLELLCGITNSPRMKRQ